MQKVLIAEDHPLFRDAIREVVARLFTARGWDFVCLEATDAKELFEAVGSDDDLDLILLDLFMPGSNGLADLVTVRERVPGTPIVVISSLEDPSVVRRALACGAAGYIVKIDTEGSDDRSAGNCAGRRYLHPGGRRRAAGP
jgi:DNA-binding NarL/FixJ family response regulator